MSSSSTRNNIKEQQVERCERWVPYFCEKTFFGSCNVHPNLQENNQNRYCINCDASICKHCTTADAHGDHKILQIYRHVYQDAVRKADMEPYIGCSKIQAYRNNGKMVIVLQPLPHKGAGEANKKRACHVCKRILMPDREEYSFCSIACRVKAGFRKNKRKGTPYKSPTK